MNICGKKGIYKVVFLHPMSCMGDFFFFFKQKYVYLVLWSHLNYQPSMS